MARWFYFPRGWTVQQLSAHLQYRGETMHCWLQAWQLQGVSSVRGRSKEPPDAARCHAVTAALWSCGRKRVRGFPQLATAIGTRFQIQLGARSTRRFLREMDATCRRIKVSLQRRQDPFAVK